MTVSYQYYVASSTSGGFIRLLFRWRGSVWKLVYREFVVFAGTYLFLSLMYRYFLTEFQKRIFERVVYFCSSFVDLIPLSFVLGFYVSFTATRWWNQYTAIPWPDKLMNIVALYVPGLDETSRMVRRTLMRYVNLSLVLVLRSISMAVKRRFPTKDHLVEAGFMTKAELEMFQTVPSTEFNTFWIPYTWFINLLRESRVECRINDSSGVKLMMEELNEFRSKCGLLWSYDWISIPLVYTQVVTMATYAFFVASVFGRQYVTSTDPEINSRHRFDDYVPVFTVLQFFFYMGLLKVAEQLVNPFGDDDEDFELNWMIDRHLKVSYLGVDTLNCGPPPLVKDSYFYEMDIKLPYTEASVSYKRKTYRGSVANMHVPHAQQGLVVPEFKEDTSDEDAESEEGGLGPRRPSLWTLVGGPPPAGCGQTSPQSSHLHMAETASLESNIWSSVNSLTNERRQSSGTEAGRATATVTLAAETLEVPKNFLIECPTVVRVEEQVSPRPRVGALKGIIRKLKPSLHSNSKSRHNLLTLKPYILASNRGVTFAADTKDCSSERVSNVVFETTSELVPELVSLHSGISGISYGSENGIVVSSPEVHQLVSDIPEAPRKVVLCAATPRRVSFDSVPNDQSTCRRNSVAFSDVNLLDDPDYWLRHNSLPNVKDILNCPPHLTARSISQQLEVMARINHSTNSEDSDDGGGGVTLVSPSRSSSQESHVWSDAQSILSNEGLTSTKDKRNTPNHV